MERFFKIVIIVKKKLYFCGMRLVYLGICLVDVRFLDWI